MESVSQQDVAGAPTSAACASAACASSDHDQDLAYAKMLQEQDYAWFMMNGGDASFGLDDDQDMDAPSAHLGAAIGSSDDGRAGDTSQCPPMPRAADVQNEQHRDHLRMILGMMMEEGDAAGAGPALDLESMTYEELQVLGEAIGKVQVGVSQPMLQQLPVLKYSEAAASCPGIDTKCAVCQEQLESADSVITLRCRHIYHKDCILQWLACSKQCPICNACVDETTTA